MKVSITELRSMIVEAVRRTVSEAKKKPKLAAPQSEESINAARARQLQGLPGYQHGEVLDMSKPLGKANLLKRQGATGIGNWTSESLSPDSPRDVKFEAIRALVRMIVAEEIRLRRGR